VLLVFLVLVVFVLVDLPPKKWTQRRVGDNMKASSSDGGGQWKAKASKRSMLIHRHKFRTRDEARRKIFESVEMYYNRRRGHSTLGNLSPFEYERQAVN
jgi:transposase InsO family protein